MCPRESVSLGHEALLGVTWTHFEPRAEPLEPPRLRPARAHVYWSLFGAERGAAKPGRAASALHTRTERASESTGSPGPLSLPQRAEPTHLLSALQLRAAPCTLHI
ncbi:hypothetical protein AOLI_G00168610 [Acnodon oligacanthus]